MYTIHWTVIYPVDSVINHHPLGSVVCFACTYPSIHWIVICIVDRIIHSFNDWDLMDSTIQTFIS